MDVLTGVASIAFSLCIDSFNSFVQYSDYHLISAYHNLSIHPKLSNNSTWPSRHYSFGCFKAISNSGRSAILKRLYLNQVGIVRTLTSKYISGQ